MNSIVQTIPRLLIETKTRSFDKKQNYFYHMQWEKIKNFFLIFLGQDNAKIKQEEETRAIAGCHGESNIKIFLLK